MPKKVVARASQRSTWKGISISEQDKQSMIANRIMLIRVLLMEKISVTAITKQVISVYFKAVIELQDLLYIYLKDHVHFSDQEIKSMRESFNRESEEQDHIASYPLPDLKYTLIEIADCIFQSYVLDFLENEEVEQLEPEKARNVVGMVHDLEYVTHILMVRISAIKYLEDKNEEDDD